MIYLIQYDRTQGQLVNLVAFRADNKQRAEEARLEVELALLRAHVWHEVVLLEAKNEHELRKTHRRYFERLDQLLTESSVVAQ